MQKRKSKKAYTLIIISICFCLVSLSGCFNVKYQKISITKGEFSAHFLNLEEGECALIKYEDDTLMVIDCGNNEKLSNKCVGDNVKICGGVIDYLVLTQPNSSFIAGAEYLLNNFTVKKAFVPKITDKTSFPTFNKIYQKLQSKGVEIQEFNYLTNIIKQKSLTAFLSPQPSFLGESSLNAINSGVVSAQSIKDVSPIIYVEHNGVRFLLATSLGYKEQDKVSDYISVDFYNSLNIYNGKTIDLKDVDFFKVSDNGSKSGRSQKLFDNIKAKNCIIVASNVNPSAVTIEGLISSNENTNVLRTDIYGSISVSVNGLGEIKTTFESGNN